MPSFTVSAHFDEILLELVKPQHLVPWNMYNLLIKHTFSYKRVHANEGYWCIKYQMLRLLTVQHLSTDTGVICC